MLTNRTPRLAMWLAIGLQAACTQSPPPVEGSNGSDLINQAANTTCVADAQCADTLLCRPSNKYDLAYRCQPPGTDHSLCGKDSECAEGYMCQGAFHLAGVEILTAGTCVAGNAPRCALDLNVECGDVVCRPTSPGGSETDLDNRCETRGNSGDYCMWDGDCIDGLVCNGSSPVYSDAGTCGAPNVQ